jgi:hypothetical protein
VTILEFMGEHPILTIILLMVLMAGLHDIASAISGK